MSGSLAEANLYRFSSKEFHPNSGLVYYLYRYYEPNLQRWISTDPSGEMGGLNLYCFVRNCAISLLDYFGLKPGDCYKSLTDAARAALSDINGESIENNWEYGGWIYKTPCGYTYGPPRTDYAPDWVKVGPVDRSYGKPVGEYHTHAKATDPEDEHFSGEDKKNNLKRYRDFNNMEEPWWSYLGTPGNHLKCWETYDSTKGERDLGAL